MNRTVNSVTSQATSTAELYRVSELFSGNSDNLTLFSFDFPLPHSLYLSLSLPLSTSQLRTIRFVCLCSRILKLLSVYFSLRVEYMLPGSYSELGMSSQERLPDRQTDNPVGLPRNAFYSSPAFRFIH